MKSDLPTRLGKSPLIDAIFEVRFSGAQSLSSILTGVIFSGLHCTEISKLPHADIPENIRMADPNLRYLILSNLTWGDYSIGVGDNVLTLIPKHPYPGWGKFEGKIREVINFLSSIPFIQNYERFSFKYIDILEENIHHCINETLAFKFSLGNRDFNRKSIQIRTELPHDHGVHIVQIVGQASAQLPSGRTYTGILVDIDSVYMIEGGLGKSGADHILAHMGELHGQNKALFFDLLTEDGLARMEPKYG